MTVHLENEIVSSRFDTERQMHSYTVMRGGRRWTVELPHAVLKALPPAARRAQLGRSLTVAMAGRADGE